MLRRFSRPAVTVTRRAWSRRTRPLFYASAQTVRAELLAVGGPVVLDLAHSFDLDVATVDMLSDLRREVDVEFVNVHPEALEMLQRAGLVSPPASSGPARRT